ncbi:MAG TPA: protein tyrosine phosphatase family protein [Oscillatoriales cyanobacterium M59_W2019_021]|nr:MAG: phosphatase [Cyanobacteria bacterium J055]HIK32789.1 protein tyrosine phosphatase family protein [Oscillatoriales cyanobacterium M4454_W2019_049]HIK51491.1 protein tyrosine phosphatase family protein [Oscillatoriales cyanobacterium M59_W2019_021]
MENIIKIDDRLSVQGQLTPEQVQQLADTEFKSVLNLRSANEDGFLETEQQLVETAGLTYLHTPLTPASLDVDRIEQIVRELDRLDKPTLIHCKSGMRAAFIALLYDADRQKMTVDRVLETGKQLGFDFAANPQFKQAIESYLS